MAQNFSGSGQPEQETAEDRERKRTKTAERFKDRVSDTQNTRLGKRLAYILRYGAEKEGLDVIEGGYVELNQLLRVPLLQYYRPFEILQEIEKSTSHRDTKRFERKNHNDGIYVRAVYGRRMERNPLHEGTQIPRLLESCLNHICDSLNNYDLQGFPDEFLLNAMIHKLKRQKQLSNNALRTILGPTMEHLDLDGVYVTEATIKLMTQRCPHLRVLSLGNCGYVMTDHFMQILLKKLPLLESLNLSHCRHLTDRSLHALAKHCQKLINLNVPGVPMLTESAVIHVIETCKSLTHLDIYDNRNISDTGKKKLVELSKGRNLTVVLKGLEKEMADSENGFTRLWFGGANMGPFKYTEKW